MPDPGRERVTCPNCGKGYRWQEQLVGRIVPCKLCDSEFSVPREPGLGLAIRSTADDGMYELDIDTAIQTGPPAKASVGGACPNCHNPVKDHAVICIRCGFNIAAGSVLQTAFAGPVDVVDDATVQMTGNPKPIGLLPDDPDVLRQHYRAEFVYPLVFLSAAVLLTIVNALAIAPFNPRFDADTAMIGMTTTLAYTALIVPSIMVAQFFMMLLLVHFYGSGFGDARTMLLKLAAMALAATALSVCIVMLYENWMASEGLHTGNRSQWRVKGGLILIAGYLTGYPAMRLFFDADGTEANALIIGSLIGAATGVLLAAAIFSA